MHINSEYLDAACILELDIDIAGADGQVNQDGLETTKYILEAKFLHSPDDVRWLEAFELLLNKTNPTMSSLNNQLREKLTPEQRTIIDKYLVDITVVKMIIDRKDNSTLKNADKALEIDGVVPEALLAVLRQSSSQPIEVQTGKRETRQGEAIPARMHTPVEITINDETLMRIMADTAELSRIICQTLCDAENETTDIETAVDNPSVVPTIATPYVAIALPFSEDQLASLEVRYHPPLAELLTRQTWSSEELTELAKRHQVMPSGILDAINDWSDGVWGDFLIEDSSPHIIRLDFLGVNGDYHGKRR